MTNPLKKQLIVKIYSNTELGRLEFEDAANFYHKEGYEVKQFAANSKQIIVLFEWMGKTYTVAESTLGFDEIDVP